MSESLEAIQKRLAALEAENQTLTDRLETVETENQTLTSRVQTLEEELATTQTKLEETNTRLEDCQEHQTKTAALAEATRKRTGSNKTRIEELQARELEKGAHLPVDDVDTAAIDVAGGRLERFTKDDGRTYVRLPDHDDPLERGGSPTLTHGDLLPIQQLARMDGDMLLSTTNALPTRLAVKLWNARVDSSVGDNPWERGCKGIKAYVKASDLKHWIRRQEPGTSETYAKKLVSRTIDAILELSKHRLAVRKRSERKNGLAYTERRVILPQEAEIPGEPSRTQPPETADVPG